jgi:hypothetical protein
MVRVLCPGIGGKVKMGQFCNIIYGRPTREEIESDVCSARNGWSFSSGLCALTLLCGVGGWTVQGFEHFENLMQRLFVLSILHNFLKYSKKKAL